MRAYAQYTAPGLACRAANSQHQLGNLLRVSPLSGDIQSVVELAHARLKGAMQKFIDSKVNEQRVSVYIDELKAQFKVLITPEWVRETTHRLFVTVLPGVLKAGGGYGPKAER